MPPHHLHTTVYIPVVSPPTPAPSPGPIGTVDLLPTESPGTSPPGSELYYPRHDAEPTPSVVRKKFLSTLLASCTPEELLFISATIAPRLKRDFLDSLPTELALHVLSFVEDPQTLARAERVSKRWRTLVLEGSAWKHMCEVHGYDVWEDDQGRVLDDDPLEEMEQFANFPMDPALEWLISKKRQEVGGGKGKGTEEVFSYREHFRRCYVTSASIDLLGLSLANPRQCPTGSMVERSCVLIASLS